MPRDTRPTFVWPNLARAIGDARYFDQRWLTAIATVLIIVTIATIKVLLMIPGLDSSVVELLTSIFETFLPRDGQQGLPGLLVQWEFSS